MSGFYDNPPAFPHPSGAQGCDGLSMRDYFAGQALPAVARICVGDTGAHENYAEYCATRAYLFADAMLEVRKATQS